MMSDTIAKAIKAAEDVEQQGHFRLVRAAAHGEEPGVYHEVLDRKEAEWVRVCAPLEVLANTRDADSGNWGRVVSFEDRDGVPHEWTVPIDMAHGDGGELARTLAKLGLDIEPTRKAREALAAYIAKWAPTGSLRCVDRTGWHGDAYVLPDRTFGGSERIVLQGRGTRKPSFGCAGTLEGWRRDIAANVVGNSRLVFGVSMGSPGR
jgi:putative DNA primase/helicase